jgi:cytochrome c biogenesis protein CcmG/thiol:disulfide interchange protein DsbE
VKTQAVLVAVVAAALLGVVPGARAGVSPLLGRPAPEISAECWFNSPPLTLKALRGQVVVVEFWATWCVSCRASAAHLMKLEEKFAGQGVVFVSLSNEPRQKVEPFVLAMKMPYAVGGGSPTFEKFAVGDIPKACVLNTFGVVVWVGNAALESDKLEAAIARQLKANPPDLKRAAKAGLDKADWAMKNRKEALAASILAKLAIPPGEANLLGRADALRKAMAQRATERLAEGEQSLADKDYYGAVQAFEVVMKLAPDSEDAKKAEAHIKQVMADPAAKAGLELQRQAADEAARKAAEAPKRP